MARCQEVGRAFCVVEAQCRPSTDVDKCTNGLWTYWHCSDRVPAPNQTQPQADSCAAAWAVKDCYYDVIQKGLTETSAPMCPSP